MELVHSQLNTSQKRLDVFDWLYAALIVVAAVVAEQQYGQYMDIYEHSILIGSTLGLIALGWFWKSWRWFFPLTGALALAAIALYAGDINQGQSRFFLRYLLSSQSAIMWCACFSSLWPCFGPHYFHARPS